MAHILDVELPTVEPSGATSARGMDIRTTADMFGGIGARAVEGLGGALEKAGNTGVDILAARQALTNEVHANEKLTWYADQATNKWEAYKQLEGKSAAEALPQFKTDLDDLRKKTLDGESLQVQAHLSRGVTSLQDRYYGWGSSHAASQERAWHDKVATDSAATFGNQAVLAATSGTWDEVESSLNKSADEVTKLYEQRGWKGDEINQQVAKVTGANVHNIVSTLINNGDIRTAQSVYDKYQDRMDAASRVKASAAIKAQRNLLDGRDVADEELGRKSRDDGGLGVNAALDKASAATGVPIGMLRTFAKIESGGNPNATKGSYSGLFQLSDAEFKKYGGGNILDPVDNAMAAARKIAAESEAFSSKYGREPTAGDLYLIHQQGAAGYEAHLRNPDAPAWQNMLSTGEGRAKGEGWAKAAIWGNIPDRDKAAFGSVDNVTSRQFRSLWMARVGDGPGGPLPDRADAFERILARTADNPQVQNAALTRMNQIYSVYNKDQAQQSVALQQRVKDSLAEAATTGTAAKPLTEEDFVGTLGSRGLDAYDDYQKSLRTAADAKSLSTLSPADAESLFKRYTPAPGSEGYEDATKRLQGLDKIWTSIQTARAKDPAQFSIANQPAVGEAWQAMRAAIADPQLPLAQKQAAVRTYADAALDGQAYLGVPENQRTIVPKDFLATITAELDNPPAAGGGANVGAQLQAQAALWGDHWPDVYRQLTKEGTSSLVRVLGSGVQPAAAKALVDNQHVKLADILKNDVDPTTKIRTITDAVHEAMIPFNKTLTGSDKEATATNFRDAAVKLATIYVGRGDDAGTAAQRAADQLVNFKYDMSGTYRIPKLMENGAPAPWTRREIESGAAEATRTVGDLQIAIPPDRGEGYTSEYRERAKLNAIRRNGTWINSPDEKGLMLSYDDKVVQRKDGRPVMLTWQQLSDMNRGARERMISNPDLGPTP
jgi:hypothetical protein